VKDSLRLLFVSPYFPPAAGIGTFRATKWVKYLSRIGWKCGVVALPVEEYENQDSSLMQDTPPEDQLFRLPVPASWVFSIIFGRRKILLWSIALGIQMGRILKKWRPRLVLITAGPFESLILVPWIRFRFRLPVVVDLRDPWSLEVRSSRRSFRKKTIDAFWAWVERRVFRSADLVVCATQIMEDAYRARYPQWVSKLMTIPNGFDSEDFDRSKQLSDEILPLNKERGVLTLVYAGKFRSDGPYYRDPSLLFGALRSLNAQGPRIRMVVIGDEEARVREDAERFGVTNSVLFLGSKSYYETLSLVSQADALVILGGTSPIEQTGKVFDYLGSGKPVLALARKDGGIAEMAARFDHIYLFSQDEANALHRCLLSWVKSGLPTGYDGQGGLEEFERSFQVKALDYELRSRARL